MIIIVSFNIDYDHVPVTVRIYAGEACFGKSVGLRGRFGRASLCQVGVRLGQSQSPGEPGRTYIYIYIYIYVNLTIGDSEMLAEAQLW